MFGDRLKLARKRAGLSLRQLSEALEQEVSAQAIGKYERGEMMPGSRILARLASMLGVSLEYLLSEQIEALDGIEFRKASGTTAGNRARVQTEVMDHLQRYLAIEEILGLDSGSWKPPKQGNRFVGIESEGENLAEDLRKEWKLGIEPIPNMTALLEDKGIKVLLLQLPKGVSGLTAMVRRSRVRSKVPVIVVNRDITLERRRLTMAHELAHRLISADSPVDHEKASNVFAGAFLVPFDHLVNEIGKQRHALGYRDIVYLKRMYRVSAAALVMRLGQVGIVDQSSVANAFRTYARKWRSTEPDPLEPEGEKGEHEAARRFERLCYWALAEKLITPAKAGELLRQSPSEIEQGLRGPAEADADGGG